MVSLSRSLNVSIFSGARRPIVPLVALTLSALAVTAVAPSAHAQVLAYTGFNYGSTSGSLDGKSGGGDIGLQGTWANNGTAFSGTTPQSNYLSTGLTFSDLPVTGGAAQEVSVNAAAAAARQLNTGARTGTIYGSYLFQINSDNATGNVGSLLLGAAATNDDTTSKLGFANNEYNTNNAGARIAGQQSNFTGTALSVNTTYLYAFRVDGLGATTQTVRGWVLTSAQYDSVKSGGVTDAKLNATNTETGTFSSASNVAFTGTDYFRLYNYSNTGTGTALTTTFDEVRLAGADINEAITGQPNAAAAAAPEPGSIALFALAGLPAVGMIARRRRQRSKTA